MLTLFKIEQTVEDDRYRLALSGELDMASAPELGKRITTLCEAGALCIVIDLQAVEFIDSSGLREIMAAKDRCADQHTEFRVVPPRHPAPTRVFDVIGVRDAIPWEQADSDEPLPA
jgi:anti-sigma B factor antagonist